MFYTSARISPRGNKWRGFLSYKDEDGNNRQVSKTLDATGKAEAKRELATWRAEMENAHEIEVARGPEAVSAAKRPVPDYVDSFIDSLEARQAIEASSVKGYRSSAKFIREEFSKVTVADLKPEQVERWETALTERGLSSSTVGKAHRLLKQAFKNAVNCRVIDFNPVDPVKPPKRRNKKPGINALDVDGRTELLGKLDEMELTQLYLSPISCALTLQGEEHDSRMWGPVGLSSLMEETSLTLADGSTLLMSRLLDLTGNPETGRVEAVFQLERITDPEQVASVTVFGETIPVS